MVGWLDGWIVLDHGSRRLAFVRRSASELYSDDDEEDGLACPEDCAGRTIKTAQATRPCSLPLDTAAVRLERCAEGDPG